MGAVAELFRSMSEDRNEMVVVTMLATCTGTLDVLSRCGGTCPPPAYFAAWYQQLDFVCCCPLYSYSLLACLQVMSCLCSLPTPAHTCPNLAQLEQLQLELCAALLAAAVYGYACTCEPAHACTWSFTLADTLTLSMHVLPRCHTA